MAELCTNCNYTWQFFFTTALALQGVPPNVVLECSTPATVDIITPVLQKSSLLQIKIPTSQVPSNPNRTDMAQVETEQ